MNNQFVYTTDLKDIASERRLTHAFSVQKELGKPAFYVLPSHLWLKAARQKQPGLLVTTFDDIANYLLKQAGHSYVSLTEQERSLFFQQFMREDEEFGGEVHLGKAQGYADTYGQVKRLGLALNDLPESITPMHSLFSRYENKITKERNLLDPENIILRAIEILETMTEQVNVSLITIDGYYDFSPLQALLIEALVKANVQIDLYVPSEEPFEIAGKTAEELVSMGFQNKRQAGNELISLIDKELVAATTTEEQWRGVMEEIRLSELDLTDIGVVVVDERNGINELERFAKMYELPLNKSLRRPLSSTSVHAFLLTALKQTRAQKTKWEQLPFVEHILKLYSVRGLSYAKQKQIFIQTGEWMEQEHRKLFDDVLTLSWSKNDRFIDYLKKLSDFVKCLEVVSYWEKQFEEETNVSKLKEIADEYKAWNEIVQQLEESQQQLVEKGLEELNMSIDLFAEWFKEIGDRIQLFKERGTKRGLVVHTWRDVGLFRGKKLYVVGMNEGVFPSVNKLSGYVQERDLIDSAVRFSPPTQAHVRKKQQAHYNQLNYVAESVTFSYVQGVDSNHPLLPSPLLENVNERQDKWSWDERMKQCYALTKNDQVDKVAFHIGRKCEVDDVSSELETVVKRLNRLDKAEEHVDVPFDEKESVVSVTALESYARCPFQYGMQRIMNVKESKEQQERVSPLDIGQLIHSVIEETYKKLELVGIAFGEAKEEQLERVPGLVDELFEEKWEEVERQSPEIPRLDIQLTKQEWKKQLKRWWQAERKHFWDNKALSQMSIMALEKPIRLDFPLERGNSLILTGKADRVDHLPESFVIYDYKTGKASVNMKEVQAGLKLQLPLYALAIQEEISNEQNRLIKADGATYVSLKEPSKRAGNGVWRSEYVGKGSRYLVTHHCKNSEDELGTTEFLTKYNMNERIDQLWTGMHKSLDVKPLDCATFCPYRSVCRVTEAQIEATSIK